VDFLWNLHSSSEIIPKYGCVCKVRTEEPENFDEEVKSLVTACRIFSLVYAIPFQMMVQIFDQKITIAAKNGTKGIIECPSG